MAGPKGKASSSDRKALNELGERIDSARERLNPKRESKHTKYNTLTLAWRMVLELVIGVVIGGSIGYALDWAMGTIPLMLVLFGGLGFAGGMKAMLASARSIDQSEDAAQSAAKGDGLG